MDGLFEALRHLYSDQESSKVLALTQKVAAVFGRGKRFAEGNELEELKQLRADAEVSDGLTPASIRRYYFFEHNILLLVAADKKLNHNHNMKCQDADLLDVGLRSGAMTRSL